MLDMLTFRMKLAWIALFAVACTKDPVDLGSVHVVTQTIGPAGGTIEVTAAHSPRIAGTRLAIPAGALAADTEITVGIGEASIAGPNSTPIGEVVELGPDGLRFQQPVVLTLPFTGAAIARRLTVFVKDAAGLSSIPAHRLTLDDTAKTVRFQIEHFTDFQCANTNQDPCTADECGPAPEIASWTCADGTAGGPTGQCIRSENNACAWEIRWCSHSCDPAACGPEPLVQWVCPGNAPGMVVCQVDANGACAWGIECAGTCNDPANSSCPQHCTDGQICPDGTACDPATGNCVPNGATCGANTCGLGEWCCNSSCGICAVVGESCPETACNTCADGTVCPPGQACDPSTGTCSGNNGGTPCGPNTCGANQYCCNESCGLCASADQGCDLSTCTTCGSDPGSPVCPPDQTCDAAGQCVPLCSPADCANQPQPGLPNWTCEDGTTGGPTGDCVPTNASSPVGQPACGWEIRWCTRACEDSECGPQPGQPNYTCPDGTVAGPTGECRRAADGSCGWVIINCPS